MSRRQRPYLMLIIDYSLVIQNKVFASHSESCLCQQLLQNYSADDSCDRQASVNCWVESVKLDIPVAAIL